MADIRIDELVAATAIDDDDFLILGNGNRAKKLSGETLSNFVYETTGTFLSNVEQSVDELESKIEDATIQIDPTLAVAGKAADAKITGDRLKDFEIDFGDLKEALGLYLIEILNRKVYLNPAKTYFYESLAEACGVSVLSSITVSFVQGANKVYSTTELNALKQYLTVTANYTDGTSTTVAANDYGLGGTLDEGTSYISVFYNGKESEFSVTVSPITLSSITAVFVQGSNKVYTTTQLNALKQYLTVTANYSDGATAELTASEYTLSGTLTEGTSVITVSYNNKTTSFNVVVDAVTITSVIAVFAQGEHKVYPTTELNSLKQYLTVTANYSDGSSNTISTANYTLSGTLSEGTSVITVSYSGNTTTFNVTVDAVTLSSISALFNSGNVSIHVGDTVESLKSYLQVSALYSDNTSVLLNSSAYVLSGTLVEGSNTITVSYGGKTTTFNVVAIAEETVLESITAVYNPASNDIYPTDAVNDLKNYLIVTANYSDGTTVTLQSNEYTLAGSIASGSRTITVSYSGAQTTFVVVVLDSITAVFNKGSYEVHAVDNINSLKRYLTITGNYSNSSTRILQSGEYTLSGTLAVGTCTVTATHGTLSTSFNTVVDENPTGLLYDWDFTKSLEDERQLEIALLGTGEAWEIPGKSEGTEVPVRSLDGVYLNYLQQFIRLISNDVDTSQFLKNKTIQVDFGSFAQNGSYDTMRTLTVARIKDGGKDAGYKIHECGLIWVNRSAPVGESWIFAAPDPTDSRYEDGSLKLYNYKLCGGQRNDLNRTTLSVCIDNLGYWSLYFDDTLKGTAEASVTSSQQTAVYGLQIGAGGRPQYGGCLATGYVTGARIYIGNQLFHPLSITISFNQGSNTIYTDQEVDSLKQYLVVTANYLNNVTRILQDNDYNLSGLLNEGTNVIAVSFDGVTATFSVTASVRPLIASFNKGSYEVYPTDNINSLKRYLTVTDNSSGNAVVLTDADYTLSGTLSVGTCTITVTHNNDTVTFNVDVSTNTTGLLYEWDFTESLTDKRQLTTAMLGTGEAFEIPGKSAGTTPPVQGSTGIIFNDAQQFVRLISSDIETTQLLVNKRIDVDFAEFSKGSTQKNVRVLMVSRMNLGARADGYKYFEFGLAHGVSNLYDDDGTYIGQSAGNTWHLLAPQPELSSDGSLGYYTSPIGTEALTGLNGSTLSVYINSEGNWAVKTKSWIGGSNSKLITSLNTATYGLQIGAGGRPQYGGCLYNARITGVRIYNAALDYIYVTVKASMASLTIYPSTDINTLKNHVSIGAWYSGASTARFLSNKEYTLSGTLEVGTSTITASYSGSTATFDVTVSPE